MHGCAVMSPLGEGKVVGEEGGFVVEAGDILDERHELGAIARVGAVGVGAWRSCRGGEKMVGDDCAVFCCPVNACFDVVYLREGYMIVVDGIAANMGEGGFLAEKVAAAGDAMGEWKGGYGEGAVFVYGLWLV